MTQREFNSKLVRMQGDLRTFANHLTMNKDRADDLMQDIFLKAMENKDTLARHGCPEAWLRMVMKNYFIDTYKANFRHNNIVDYTKDQSYINQRPDENYVSAQSELETQEIKKFVSLLGHKVRIPLEMYLDGYLYREIAETLHVNIDTVKGRIHRARIKLMKVLKDYN